MIAFEIFNYRQSQFERLWLKQSDKFTVLRMDEVFTVFFSF